MASFEVEDLLWVSCPHRVWRPGRVIDEGEGLLLQLEPEDEEDSQCQLLPPVLPSLPLSSPFWGEGSPTTIDVLKKVGTPILTSLLEDLVLKNMRNMSLCGFKGNLSLRAIYIIFLFLLGGKKANGRLCFAMDIHQACGIKGFVPTSVIQGNPFFMWGVGLWEALFVVSRKW